MNRTNLYLKEHLIQYMDAYREKIIDLYDSINPDIFHSVVQEILRAIRENHTIFLAGNGGSAATASHIHEDLSFFIRHATDKKPKVQSLTNNIAYISAIANDIGYDKIFVEQLRDHFVSGDILIAISASGNSPNVIQAVEYANRLGGVSIGFVGFDGGVLKKICSLCIHTTNPKGEYGPIEDLHLILGHLIASFLSTFGIRELIQ